jgi:hypothetical protein
MSITRRIIAIAFSACGAGVWTYLAVTGSDTAIASLGTAVSLILGYYFGNASK